MITDHNRFQPSTIGLFEPPYYKLGSRANFSCYQNPTKSELKAGNYKPRLTVTKRMRNGGFFIALRIEFSAPKLLMGNNFNELCDNDFDRLILTLLDKLEQMGVITNYEKLADAEISAIHYSKNIALIDYTSSSMIINELSKQNLNKRLDLNKTDYRNEGHSIRCHTSSYELIFYDKIKDLQQGKKGNKRAIEKDSFDQLSIFDDKNIQKPFEVIRMELRLGNRTKMKQVLKDVNESDKMTLGLLYNSEVSQKILLHFWNQIKSDLYLASISEEKPEIILEKLLELLKPAKALQIIGGLTMINQIGARGLRALIEKHTTSRTWQRISKEITETKIEPSQRFKAITNIELGLKEFSPMKLEDYKL